MSKNKSEIIESKQTIENSAELPFDFETFCPARDANIKIFDRGEKEKDRRYSLKNSYDNFLILSEEEKSILDMFDGEKNVHLLSSDYMEEHGTIALVQIKALIFKLWSEGFLTVKPDNVPQGNAKSGLGIKIPKMDAIFSLMYRLGGMIIVNHFIFLLLAGFSLAAAFHFFEKMVTPTMLQSKLKFHLFQVDGSFPVAFAVILLSLMMASLVRSIFRGLAIKKYNLKVHWAGLKMDCLLGFHVDTLETSTLPLGKRIFIRLSGILGVLIVGGILSLFLIHLQGQPLQEHLQARLDIAFISSLVFFLYIIFHLCPFYNGDGYLAATDYFHAPYLRKSSFNFIAKHVMKLFKNNNESEPIVSLYIIFNVLGVLWLILIAQLSLTIMGTNSAIITDVLFKKGSERILPWALFLILVLPVIVGILYSAYWLFKFVWRWLSSKVVFKKMMNVILASIATSYILILFLRFFYGASSAFAFISIIVLFLVGFQIITFTNKQGNNPLKSQFMILAIIAFSVMILNITKLTGFYIEPMTLNVLYLLISSGFFFFALFNFSNDFNEFFVKKRDFFLIIIAGVILGGVSYEMGTKIFNGAGSGVWGNYTTETLVSSIVPMKAIISDKQVVTIVYTFLVIALFLLLPTLMYRRKTEYFAPTLALMISLALIIVTNLYSYISISENLEIYNIEEFHLFGNLLFWAAIMTFKENNFRFKLEAKPYKIHLEKEEKEILANSFEYLVENILKTTEKTWGASTASSLETKFNKFAKKVGWDWTLRNIVRESESVNILGDTYKNAFERLKNDLVWLCGKAYTETLICEIFEQLHWQARDIMCQRVANIDKKSTPSDLKEYYIDEDKKRDLIKQAMIFEGVTESEMPGLLTCIHTQMCDTGDVLIQQGDVGDRFYIVSHGTVQVEIEDMAGHVNIVAYMSEGDFFGEIALLQEVERTATVRALTPVALIYLKKPDFETYVNMHKGRKEAVEEAVERIRIFKNIPLFRDFNNNIVNNFVTKMKHDNFDKNETIIKQGDAGDKFYVIIDGDVEISIHNKDAEDKIIPLSKGEYFGEIALLQDIPRTATVTAKTDVKTFSLDKENFLSTVGNYELLESNLEKISQRRMLETKW